METNPIKMKPYELWSLDQCLALYINWSLHYAPLKKVGQNGHLCLGALYMYFSWALGSLIIICTCTWVESLLHHTLLFVNTVLISRLYSAHLHLLRVMTIVPPFLMVSGTWKLVIPSRGNINQKLGDMYTPVQPCHMHECLLYSGSTVITRLQSSLGSQPYFPRVHMHEGSGNIFLLVNPCVHVRVSLCVCVRVCVSVRGFSP